MDLAAAREVFETSQDLTVGIEEEWAIVDPVTLELPRASRTCATTAPAIRCSRPRSPAS